MSELKLQDAVRDLMIDLCRVLHDHGYEHVSLGALLKIMGFPDEQCIEHDDEYLDIATYFQERQDPDTVKPPSGTTIH